MPGKLEFRMRHFLPTMPSIAIALRRMRSMRRLAFRTCLSRSALAFVACLAATAAAVAQPRIVEPAAGATIHSNSGQVQVVVAGVLPSQRLQPLLDGAEASGPVDGPQFDLQGVVRGSHVLVVKIIDADGRVVGRTAAVKFYVKHASRLAPRHDRGAPAHGRP